MGVSVQPTFSPPELEIARAPTPSPWWSPCAGRNLRLESAQLSPERRARLKIRLNFLCNVCGCMPASIALLLMLAWQLGSFYADSAHWASVSLWSLAFGISRTVVVALAVKLIVLAMARGLIFIEVFRFSRKITSHGRRPDGAPT
jgi:hypothetical protein